MHYSGRYNLDTVLPNNFTSNKKKILIIDDDEVARVLIAGILESTKHYTVVMGENGTHGIRQAVRESPDLIILDIVLPEMTGFEVCKILRADIATRYIPIIMLSVKAGVIDRIEGLVMGGDDYMTKPFNHDELIARVDALLRRNELSLDANPLTRLPGNISIERELMKRLADDRKFAVGYADLDNFKAFNDKYGFTLGDRVLFDAGRIMKDIVVPPDFVGHIGGDDFVFISIPDKIDALCCQIIETFDSEILKYYDEESQAKRYIESKSRNGATMQFGLMSISIAVVTNLERRFTHFAEIGETGADLKKHLKTMPGSNYLIDRRRDEK